MNHGLENNKRELAGRHSTADAEIHTKNTDSRNACETRTLAFYISPHRKISVCSDQLLVLIHVQDPSIAHRTIVFHSLGHALARQLGTGNHSGNEVRNLHKWIHARDPIVVIRIVHANEGKHTLMTYMI